jgi:hypothetical protein
LRLYIRFYVSLLASLVLFLVATATVMHLIGGPWAQMGPYAHPMAGHFHLVLSLLAQSIGLAAYPLVRQISRRLERLQHGVESLGGGDLAARVAVRLDAVTEAIEFREVDLLALAAEECARCDATQLEGSAGVIRGDARLLRRLLRNSNSTYRYRTRTLAGPPDRPPPRRRRTLRRHGGRQQLLSDHSAASTRQRVALAPTQTSGSPAGRSAAFSRAAAGSYTIGAERVCCSQCRQYGEP